MITALSKHSLCFGLGFLYIWHNMENERSLFQKHLFEMLKFEGAVL